MGRRRNPGGNYYHEPNSRWRLMVTIVDGEQSYPKTFRGSTKKETTAKRDQWCEDHGIDLFSGATVRRARRTIPQNGAPQTVAVATEAHLKSEQLRDDGGRYLGQRVSTARNHLIPRLGSVEVGHVTPRMVDKLRDDMLAAGYGSSTIKQTRQLL